jgi:site-specific recombinase XerD
MAQQVNIFFDSLNSEHTKQQYQGHWERYLKSKPTDSQNTKIIESNIIKYLVEMKVQGLSPSYRNSAFSAIKHHYTMVEDLTLNWHDVSKFLEAAVMNEISGYTREEIAKLLSIADTKFKAVILTLASTGMRREALTQIKKE